MAGDRPGNGSSADRPHEFELIRRFFAPLATDPGSLGLSDDASVYTPGPGRELVLTKDMLASNVHFFADDPPEAIAAKALRVNLSDLAAKGAIPTVYLLGLGLADDWDESWLERFCCGLSGDQSAFNVVLVGGDTIRSGDGLQISITAIGEVPEGTAVRRNGAKPGDILYVSGTIGDAAAGLKGRLDPAFSKRLGLPPEETRHILDRYLLPQPRVKLADAIRTHASAAMDVSDGIFADAAHMASASGADLVIDLEAIPLSPALRHMADVEEAVFLSCLNGGDDYEILASVPPDLCTSFVRSALGQGCQVTPIGKVAAGQGELIVSRNGVSVDQAVLGGFRHF